MKKIFVFCFAVLLLVSCSKQVEFNDPGFQALKENFSWKSSFTKVSITNGQMTINAQNGLETVTLTVPAPTSSISNANPQVYKLGLLDTPAATFENSENGVALKYETAEELGDGEIVIYNYDSAAKRISGTFRFNAKYLGVDPSVQKNINFQRGNFYNIKID